MISPTSGHIFAVFLFLLPSFRKEKEKTACVAPKKTGERRGFRPVPAPRRGPVRPPLAASKGNPLTPPTPTAAPPSPSRSGACRHQKGGLK